MRPVICLLFVFCTTQAAAQAPRAVDVPTRPGVTQRFLLLQPANARAAVILFSGGNGSVQISADGAIGRNGNFLVRSRDLFAAHGLAVAVIDSPSDRQNPPFLGGFRQTAEHVADVKTVIAWLRANLNMPVWLAGTSRGTQSAAYVTTQLPAAEGGPDGVVLTSTVLADRRSRAVPAMALERIGVPVLVVHHRQDSCRVCLFTDLPLLTDKLKRLAKTETLLFDGGDNTGDACGPRAYHGYNGIEAEVVAKIAAWIGAT